MGVPLIKTDESCRTQAPNASAEALVLKARMSLWSLFPTMAKAFGILSIGLLWVIMGWWQSHWVAAAFSAVSLIVIAPAAVEYFTTEMTLTTHRVVFRSGWILRDIVELSLDRIESVRMTQSLIGRILGFGDLELSGFGTTHGRAFGLANIESVRMAVSAQLAQPRPLPPGLR